MSIKEIKSELNTTCEGTDTEPILELLINKGLQIQINEQATIDLIKFNIRRGYPLLITIDEWEHWCVIYGFTKNSILILNSWFRTISVKYPLEEFFERWDDNWIAAISI